MSTKVELAWSELTKLPVFEQEIAADAILGYVEGRKGIHLTAEQVADVERRLADPEAKSMSMDEFKARLNKLLA